MISTYKLEQAESMESQGDFLFSKLLIKKEDLEETLVTRPLHILDFEKGYCTLLNELTAVEDVDKAKWQQRFREFQLTRDTYFIVIIEDISKKKVIAAATLFIEKKVIHSIGKCGHIEDVVVNSTYRGKQLGKRVIDQLVHIGGQMGCYKIILDCSEKNISFYQKCGFATKEYQMVKYMPKQSAL